MEGGLVSRSVELCVPGERDSKLASAGEDLPLVSPLLPRDVMDTDSPVIQLDTGRTNGSQTKDTETVSLLGERELWDLTTFLIEGVVLPILAVSGILGKEYYFTPINM